jgi:hypothetical protein
MKKILPLLFVLFLFSCKKDKDGENTKDNVVPVASTLKLSRDFQAGVAYQSTSFEYTDINGVEMIQSNPANNTVEDVDFTKYVKVTAVAGNNLDPDILCNWNLKKDGVVIDVQSVSNYVYTN